MIDRNCVIWFELCECGDYRKNHVDGTGECLICKWANISLPKCQKFQPVKQIEIADGHD